MNRTDVVEHRSEVADTHVYSDSLQKMDSVRNAFEIVAYVLRKGQILLVESENSMNSKPTHTTVPSSAKTSSNPNLPVSAGRERAKKLASALVWVRVRATYVLDWPDLICNFEELVSVGYRVFGCCPGGSAAKCKKALQNAYRDFMAPFAISASAIHIAPVNQEGTLDFRLSKILLHPFGIKLFSQESKSLFDDVPASWNFNTFSNTLSIQEMPTPAAAPHQSQNSSSESDRTDESSSPTPIALPRNYLVASSMKDQKSLTDLKFQPMEAALQPMFGGKVDYSAWTNKFIPETQSLYMQAMNPQMQMSMQASYPYMDMSNARLNSMMQQQQAFVQHPMHQAMQQGMDVHFGRQTQYSPMMQLPTPMVRNSILPMNGSMVPSVDVMPGGTNMIKAQLLRPKSFADDIPSPKRTCTNVQFVP